MESLKKISSAEESSDIDEIAKKALLGERLSFEEGMRLYETKNILKLGQTADGVKRKFLGDRAFFVVNSHLNHTNICVYKCSYCAFAKSEGDKDSYAYSLDSALEKAEKLSSNTREIHIVGGLHPRLPYEFYLDLLRGIRAVRKNIHIKAFTALEIWFFSKIAKKPVEAVIEDLINAGLNSIPGGGAEIFAPEVRKKICGYEMTAEEWLNIHRALHKRKIPTTATMLFGHIERAEHRVDHLLRLRALQDETGGFTAFVPLAFHPKNTALSHLNAPTGVDCLKTIAVSRLLLDNFSHIKAYWIMLGLKLSQIALHFGADDLDGTIVEEKIAHSAGAKSPKALSREEIVKLIKEAELSPVERDSLYKTIAVW